MTYVKKVLCIMALAALAGCGVMGGSSGSGSGKTVNVTLSGAEEVPPVAAPGSGKGSGPIVVPLTKSGDTYTAPANAKLSDADLQAFREGRLYVNVHTDRNKGGEVRGQLAP